MEHLYVRSVERKISSKSKIYFQIGVSLVRISKLSNDLVDLYDFDSWVTVDKEEHKINIFHKDEQKEALEWILISFNKNSFEDINPGFIIGETNPRFEQGGVIIHRKIENIFTECLKGVINTGSLLYGTIAKRSVVPYEFDGKTVSTYTRPILWPRELCDEEKRQYVKGVFAKIGRVVIDNESSLADKLAYWRATSCYDKNDTSKYYDSIN